MDPKKFFTPTFQYVCSVIEKCKNTDQRKSGRYNLTAQLIDSIDKVSLENEYEQLPQFTKIMHLNRVYQELFDF